jgi:shikimate kinase
LQDSSPNHLPSTGPVAENRVVCLTGFMGSGKSTIGRLLAGQLAWRFTDLDEEIETNSGLSVSQIFAQRGEAVFREVEHECLERILATAWARKTRLILALGGGTFTQARNAALLRGPGALATGPAAVIVWLDCPMEELLQRCVLMGNRPLFNDEASFRKLYAERLPYYRQADHRVASTGEPMRVVEQILALGIFGRSAQTQTTNNVPGAPLP